MAKVITFSRTFPAYHPKSGQPTYFVEQIYNSLYELDGDWSNALGDVSSYVVELNHLVNGIKHHTIRNGHRFEVGEVFSPRVWSGKPYNSKQIIIAPDIEVKKVFDIRIVFDADHVIIFIDNYPFYEENNAFVTQYEALQTLAQNDGLTVDELKQWFRFDKKKDFVGQIICWNDKIEY